LDGLVEKAKTVKYGKINRFLTLSTDFSTIDDVET